MYNINKAHTKIILNNYSIANISKSYNKIIVHIIYPSNF
jgi:hypothetical protein